MLSGGIFGEIKVQQDSAAGVVSESNTNYIRYFIADFLLAG